MEEAKLELGEADVQPWEETGEGWGREERGIGIGGCCGSRWRRRAEHDWEAGDVHGR